MRQHEHHEGEVFEYLYETTESVYSTVPSPNGLPRVTDLRRIDEVRTRARFTIVLDEGRLKKHLELIDLEFRVLAMDDLQHRGSLVPFQPMRARVPALPETISHTYGLRSDGKVALKLNELFGGASDPLLGKLVDIFTWFTNLASVPEGLEVDQGLVHPPVDVELMGRKYHNHNSIFLFNRIETIGGMPHAYFKSQVPGNFTEGSGTEAIYVSGFHVPMEGPASGLVSRGELQEVIFGAHRGEDAQTALIRQVTMTLQELS